MLTSTHVSTSEATSSSTALGTVVVEANPVFVAKSSATNGKFTVFSGGFLMFVPMLELAF